MQSVKKCNFEKCYRYATQECDFKLCMLEPTPYVLSTKLQFIVRILKFICGFQSTIEFKIDPKSFKSLLLHLPWILYTCFECNTPSYYIFSTQDSTCKFNLFVLYKFVFQGNYVSFWYVWFLTLILQDKNLSQKNCFDLVFWELQVTFMKLVFLNM